jgi:hypothetical protein
VIELYQYFSIKQYLFNFKHEFSLKCQKVCRMFIEINLEMIKVDIRKFILLVYYFWKQYHLALLFDFRDILLVS